MKITDIKKEKDGPGKAVVEKSLEEDCNILQEAIELITSNDNIGYFQIARTGEVIEMNPAMLKILGLAEGSLKLQISKEIVNTLLEAVQFGESKKCVEIEIPVNKNNKVQALVSVKSVVSECKEIIIGFAEDISEKKKIQEKPPFNSKAHFHALIDNIPSLVWLKDVNGKFVIANKAFLDFFKINESAILNDNINIVPEYKEFWDFISDESDNVRSGSKVMEEKNFVFN
jgi:PAS domain-containing protein